MSGAHYFIGIPVAEEVQFYLKEEQRRLSLENYYKKLPYKDDFHITLLFLGSWEPRGKLWNAIQQRLTAFRPFQLALDQIGCFGNPTAPRVLFAGVKGGDELFDLRRHAAAAAADLDFPLENRPFRPHITLGKSYRGAGELPAIVGKTLRPLTWETAEARLYRVKQGQRPRYETFSKISFPR
ncbi:2'-5' RNA ligase [Evansella caseinilytica]|uniref:RNA 2',3'-cyclic phosphodiesterase n=1 Tax=Evansella caseinilytica TaxID=1503961 RepID=A0A1H3RUG7_9BACI|nr:RNA 2',3'-cyclic phosphodiesterase [Evansella caseinilytica]SDZ29346.1 2'-5' RNA ligase [Evansella caseinilytica]